MRYFCSLSLCCLLYMAGYAQPAGTPAIGDAEYDQFVASRPIPVITGKLLNITPEALQKTVIEYSLVTPMGQEQKTTRPAADGSFRLPLDYAFPYQQIWFNIDSLFYAGIYAYEALELELDVAKIKAAGGDLNWNGPGVRFLGKDGPLNEYMNNYILFRRKEQLALGNRMHQVGRSGKPVAAEVEAAYRPIFDSLKLIQDDYIATHPSPYGWILDNERLSEYYGQLCVSYWFHNMEAPLFAQVRQHRTYLMSNASTLLARYLGNYIKWHPANRTSVHPKELAAMPGVTDFEKSYIDSLQMVQWPNSTDTISVATRQRWVSQLQRLMQPLQQQRSLANCIRFTDSVFTAPQADVLKLWLNDSRDVDERKAALEQLLPSMQTNWSRQLAQSKYDETVTRIASINKALAGSGTGTNMAAFGKPLLETGFGASLYKVTNMNATQFLTNLKQSFPGRAIVFDLWATWCAPCLGEMPHSKKLQLSSKELPVVFVYVCTTSGSNEEKWKRKVAELEQPGVHFFIDNTLDAEIRKFFSFSGYPGYAFIDRSGVYKAGAITRISMVDKPALAALVQ
ncbi:TlpA family protein disulfide reductase [Paraflavitalea pollutisoli]|uniref:TlpA family protein disulfide reductase n=1 Tax=Paraflavitalea pollutisoli TaxID=3034143 RepID=UPI0023EC00A8|nr:TlpA disulfide reductase family protein [Paraflavitalea sp. H1-2-19X]